MPVPERVTFADVHWTYAALRSELDRAYQRVMDSGWYILSDEVKAFEAEFAEYCGTRHCVAVGNGLEALTIALRALEIGPGDEVIVPANTYIASWLAITAVGATPVPVDADEATANIDPALIPAVLGPATKAILPVHLYGQPADVRAIAEATKASAGLAVVEDAAQAHGARLDGRRAGALGSAAGFSFYPTKNLGAFGDAGAIVTDDEAIADFARLFRNYGSPRKYDNVLPGANSRLDPLQAAFLRVKLAHLDNWNARRAEIAERYLSEIPECGGLLRLPRVLNGSEPVWHVFCVRSELRDQLAAALNAKGIETLIHYPVPPYASGAYAADGPWPAMPVSDRLAAQSLSLPMGPHLDDDAVAAVIAAVNAFTAEHEHAGEATLAAASGHVEAVLPNLLIPGAAKSGTTSLHGYLKQHPDVFMSDWKEPHFFSNPEFYAKGIDEYAKLFADAGDARIRGESSTTYFQFPHVVERIQASLPACRFIFVLRNPIDRTESHYRWLVSLGLEDRPPREALLADFDQSPTFDDRIGGAKFRFYVDESRYGKYVGRYLAAFDRDDVLVLTDQALRGDRQGTLDRCAQFLGIGPFPEVAELSLNETATKAAESDRLAPPPFTTEERAWLAELLAPEVQELRALLGQSFAEWDADFPLGVSA